MKSHTEELFFGEVTIDAVEANQLSSWQADIGINDKVIQFKIRHFSKVKTESVCQSENGLPVPKVQNVGTVSQTFQSAGGADHFVKPRLCPLFSIRHKQIKF